MGTTLSIGVKAYLDSRRVNYEIVRHPRVLSTVEEAKTLGIDTDEVAKTLVIHVTHTPGDMALVVIPGSKKLSNNKTHDTFATKHARLATEDEMSEAFPQIELGAVPPLGELLDLPIYIDEGILDHETVVFEGGSHTDSVKMDTQDLFNLADSILVDITED